MGAGQDQDAFRKALEAADFASNRGDFASGPNAGMSCAATDCVTA